MDGLGVQSVRYGPLLTWILVLPLTAWSAGRCPRRGPAGLDAAQQRVVSHTSGPLLVLAGPGTGKTTAIVESVVRADQPAAASTRNGCSCSRSAARPRGAARADHARLGRTTRQPLALTFHSYAYALVRREFMLAGDEPPTLLSGPEQLLEVRRLLRGEAEDGGGPTGRNGSGRRWAPGVSPPNCGTSCSARPNAGWTGAAWPGWARSGGRDDWVAAGGFLDRYAARFDLAPVPAYDYAEIVRIAAAC